MAYCKIYYPASIFLLSAVVGALNWGGERVGNGYGGRGTRDGGRVRGKMCLLLFLLDLEQFILDAESRIESLRGGRQ